MVSDHFLCGDGVGQELAGVKRVGHIQINKDLNPVQCAFAPHSIPLADAKNPALMVKAPPEWFYRGLEALMLGTQYVPSAITRALGTATYPVTVLINKVIAWLFKRS